MTKFVNPLYFMDYLEIFFSRLLSHFLLLRQDNVRISKTNTIKKPK